MALFWPKTAGFSREVRELIMQKDYHNPWDVGQYFLGIG